MRAAAAADDDDEKDDEKEDGPTGADLGELPAEAHVAAAAAPFAAVAAVERLVAVPAPGAAGVCSSR